MLHDNGAYTDKLQSASDLLTDHHPLCTVIAAKKYFMKKNK